ncbi:MAG TPA: helix-turn-helix transcriptional regulator [Candidatus Binataceae bacterium]|nr:helix-turn-helix transcriptional regulator [Candidatus Binataceae bacterium]
MKNKTFGPAIKEAREAQRLTQRGLAEQVGVKASHIAYIENGFRRPSLSLLRRLADTLGLDPREMLLLAHPEAKYLIGDAGVREQRKGEVWRRFASNRGLLRRHNVTAPELRLLKQVSLLQDVTSPGHFFFILNAIRQSAESAR